MVCPRLSSHLILNPEHPYSVLIDIALLMANSHGEILVLIWLALCAAFDNTGHCLFRNFSLFGSVLSHSPHSLLTFWSVHTVSLGLLSKASDHNLANGKTLYLSPEIEL